MGKSTQYANVSYYEWIFQHLSSIVPAGLGFNIFHKKILLKFPRATLGDTKTIDKIIVFKITNIMMAYVFTIRCLLCIGIKSV